MADPEPVTTLSPFSGAGAVPTAWAQGCSELRDAEVYWLSTVRFSQTRWGFSEEP